MVCDNSFFFPSLQTWFTFPVWTYSQERYHTLSGHSGPRKDWLSEWSGAAMLPGNKHLRNGFQYRQKFLGLLLLESDESVHGKVLFGLCEDSTLPGGVRTIMGPISTILHNLLVFVDWVMDMKKFDGVTCVPAAKNGKNCAICVQRESLALPDCWHTIESRDHRAISMQICRFICESTQTF